MIPEKKNLMMESFGHELTSFTFNVGQNIEKIFSSRLPWVVVSLNYNIKLDRVHQKKFSLKSYVVNVLDFLGCKISAATTQL